MHGKHRASRADKLGIPASAGLTAPPGLHQCGTETSKRGAARWGDPAASADPSVPRPAWMARLLPRGNPGHKTERER